MDKILNIFKTIPYKIKDYELFKICWKIITDTELDGDEDYLETIYILSPPWETTISFLTIISFNLAELQNKIKTIEDLLLLIRQTNAPRNNITINLGLVLIDQLKLRDNFKLVTPRIWNDKNIELNLPNGPFGIWRKLEDNESIIKHGLLMNHCLSDPNCCLTHRFKVIEYFNHQIPKRTAFFSPNYSALIGISGNGNNDIISKRKHYKNSILHLLNSNAFSVLDTDTALMKNKILYCNNRWYSQSILQKPLIVDGDLNINNYYIHHLPSTLVVTGNIFAINTGITKATMKAKVGGNVHLDIESFLKHK